MRAFKDRATISGNVATTVADGANVVEGATTDAANTTGTTGTISGKLRGLLQLIVSLIAAPTNSTSAALEASRIAKASAGRLWGLSGFNSGPGQYVQIHDSATLPANGAVPANVIFVPASSPFAMDWGDVKGRAYAAGITLCNSSTLGTKTIGAADCWFDVQYT